MKKGIKTFKYRIYPTRKQRRAMNFILDQCRYLHNGFVEQRKVAYETDKTNISCYDQTKQIAVFKEDKPELKNVHSQVLQNVATRVDLAYQAFFRRCKQKNGKAGYPRFKNNERYNSFTFPQFGNGCEILDNGFIRMSKIGNMKTVYHRPLEGKPKSMVVKRTPTGKWYVCISCEGVNSKLLPKNENYVGIDVGLTTFASMSDETIVANPRFFRKEEKALAKAQKKLSKQKKGTTERAKARKVVARVHERISFKRDDFCHQESRKIVDKYQIIAAEDLSINRMVHNHCLSKSISDAAWGKFAQYLGFKAESAGRQFVQVNPAYTSQDCCRCGHRVEKTLDVRIHKCPCCGLIIDRDLNAAINILRLGLQSLGIQPLEAPLL